MFVLQKVCQPLLVLAGSVERTLVHLQKETKKIHPKPKLTMQESKQKTGTEETDHQASGLILTCLQDSNRHTVHGQREREGGGGQRGRQTDRPADQQSDRPTDRETNRQAETDGRREREAFLSHNKIGHYSSLHLSNTQRCLLLNTFCSSWLRVRLSPDIELM